MNILSMKMDIEDGKQGGRNKQPEGTPRKGATEWVLYSEPSKVKRDLAKCPWFDSAIRHFRFLRCQWETATDEKKLGR